MEPFFKYYIAAWSLACLIALGLFLRKPAAFTVGRRSYWHFLGEPWKLATFIAGASLITLVAPYTGDPTWDWVDGLFMSVFCFTTAPWVVATLFFTLRRKVSWAETYVAICAWLFSACWSYDIYLAAGLFWNLEWQRGRGVIFSFMRGGWPSRPAESAFFRLLGYAAIFAIPAVAAVLMFFL